jgi:hypothetical protein
MVLRYRPATFRFGLIAAGAAILVLSALWCSGRRRDPGFENREGVTRV